MPRKADPRAQRSGFAKKLRAYFHAAEEEIKEFGVTEKVMGVPQLARHITAHGEKVEDRAVRYWREGWKLPHARYIGLLERLLGAPWAYLDDPKTPWPRKWGRADLVDLVSLLSDEEVVRWSAQLRQTAESLRPGRR